MTWFTLDHIQARRRSSGYLACRARHKRVKGWHGPIQEIFGSIAYRMADHTQRRYTCCRTLSGACSPGRSGTSDDFQKGIGYSRNSIRAWETSATVARCAAARMLRQGASIGYAWAMLSFSLRANVGRCAVCFAAASTPMGGAEIKCPMRSFPYDSYIPRRSRR